ncbi:MAG TPA: VOC family protein [Chitinophagaceae bacterium]|nr:VOC family protein [Chitinophagaceae bacterium]
MSNIVTSIAPWLTVKNGAAAIEFYKSAFGAVETYHLEDPEGAVVSRLSVDGAAFWLSGEAHGNAGAEAVRDGSVRMILTVVNPDEIFAKAIAAGAAEIFAVGEEHGWRLGRIEDPFGYHWEIGYQLQDE